MEREMTPQEFKEFQARRKKQDEWHFSPDGIAYNLHQYIDTQTLFDYLVITVARLPRKVVRFVCSKCIFLSVGRASSGYVLPGRCFAGARGKWVVNLTDYMTVRRSAEDVQSIIAHEIAHAYLRHDGYQSDVDSARGLAMENEACALAEEWGFKGHGTDKKVALKQYRRLEKFSSLACR